MPTSSKSSTARSMAFCLDIFLCRKRASVICFPIGTTGLRADMGSWNIMPKFAPRILHISRSPSFVISYPFVRICPWIFALSGNILITERHKTDFPQPDSPTMARVSPSLILREISRTAWTVPAFVVKETERFLIERICFIFIL